MGFFSHLTNDTLEDIPNAYTDYMFNSHRYLYIYTPAGDQLVADLYDGYGRYRLVTQKIWIHQDQPDMDLIQFSYSPDYVYRPGEKCINSPSQGFFDYNSVDPDSADAVTKIFDPDFKRITIKW